MRRVLLVILLSACPSELPPLATPPLPNQPAQAEPGCLHAFPTELDFGEIDAFTTAFGKVRITNASTSTLILHVTPLDAPWVVSPQDNPVLRPSSSMLFDVRFQPTDGLLHFAELEVSVSATCTLKVPLKGLGAGSISTTPAMLDFGLVDPGQSKTLELQFTNTRRTAVTLNDLTLLFDSFLSDGGQLPFTLDAPAQLSLPPLSTVSVLVTATPPGDDFFTATISAGSAFGRIHVPLQVAGGSPRAQVTPETIDVPKVGFWPVSTPPSFVDRLVELRNVGDAGSFQSNLRLIAPFARVESLDGGPASELQVQTPDTAVLSGLGAGQAASLVLHLEPQSPGPRGFRVTLFTNDPRQPERVVTLTAAAVSLPACSMRVAPPSVAHLSWIPDAGSFGQVSFTNAGTTACVLDDVRLARVFEPDFRITDGGVAQVELAPGAVHVVTVEGPAPGGFGSSGALLFHVFNPNADQQFIELRLTP